MQMAGQRLREAIRPVGMNYSYNWDGPQGFGFYGTKPQHQSTMDAIIAGARTSTLRKPGQLPAGAQRGARLPFTDRQGRRVEVEVVGRRVVDPSMAPELSKRELWRADWLPWYMNQYGGQGGRMEQLIYRKPDQPTIYAGIGSRDTPDDVRGVMTRLARMYESQGHLLRSGGAAGADQAFEAGVQDPRHRSIYLPGQSFQGRRAGAGGFVDATRLPTWSEADQLTNRYHPAPGALKPFMRNLMGRNAMQVLGPSLGRPADRIIAWAPGGHEGDSPPPGFREGGTGQALRMGRALGVPIINLAKPGRMEQAQKRLQELGF